MPQVSRNSASTPKLHSDTEALLVLWRDMSEPDPGSIDELRRLLASITVMGEPRWRAALAGDMAAGCGLAISAIRAERPDRCLDLAMSLLVVSAAHGNTAAPAILDVARRRLGRASDSCMSGEISS